MPRQLSSKLKKVRSAPPPDRDELDLMTLWFLGPKAENFEIFRDLLVRIFEDYAHWRKNYYPADPTVFSTRMERRNQLWARELRQNLFSILDKLKAHFPFYSPRYLAHMLSEQTIPSMLGYFASMLYNPNNVTTEAAPVTVELEIEVGKLVAEMVGFDRNRSWAHLCSGGTLATIEAFWAARAVQFLPLSIREFCSKEGFAYTVETPNGQKEDLRQLDIKDLVHLDPRVSLSLISDVPAEMAKKTGQSSTQILSALNRSIRESEYNPAYRGIHSVLGQLGLSPVIFCSAAYHYSIKKAANLLGYGEDCVKKIPVTNRFRLDAEQLSNQLSKLDARNYVAAVVGILGTTEEGAIDPLHELCSIKGALSKELNRSFWLHVDAAWGGYFASMIRGVLPKAKGSFDEYYGALNIRQLVNLGIYRDQERTNLEETIAWDEPDLVRALLSLGEADSITIDPHKMGYVPYPAGLVAFRDARVTQLLAQRAQYISKIGPGITNAAEEGAKVEEVGSFIIEGSKPGAAAAACWLSHKTIPLNAGGHGVLMRNALLNAQRLTYYLYRHRLIFDKIDQACFPNSRATHQFTFLPICRPDTNIVCFVAKPMALHHGELLPVDKGPSWINKLNERIFGLLSLDTADGTSEFIHSRAFFVSRTQFEDNQYSADSLHILLEALNVDADSYRESKLFVLRSTVMNPFYIQAQEQGKDFLLDFIKHLHKVARLSVEELSREELGLGQRPSRS